MTAKALHNAVLRHAKARHKLRIPAAAVALAITALFAGFSIGALPAVADGEVDLLSGHWNFLAGADQQADGVHVHYLGRSIVEQDGSGGQPDPPVNLYGMHLQTNGDFSVTGTISNLHGNASLRLYGAVPIVQDEFRVEPKSLQLDFSGNQVNVQWWRGYMHEYLSSQHPTFTRHVAMTAQPNTTFTIERHGSQYTLLINGVQVSRGYAYTALTTGNIWFGLNAPNPGDSWTLSKLQARGINGGSVTAVDAASQGAVAIDPDGLQQLATKKRPGFSLGAAMALAPAVSDPNYAKVAFGGNFGSLTTENALKWQFIEPQPNVFDFHDADALVDLAQKNNLSVHGHTLVFGEANPAWVQHLPIGNDNDKQHVADVMTNHITQTVSHFKGKIQSWDVVNEPLADYDDFNRGNNELRQHIWFKAMGESYIAKAFNAAHAADPNAQLYINEYGLEDNGERWDAFLDLMTRLKNQGVPVQGVGLQSHVYESSDQIDPAVLRQHIQKLAGMGLKVRISEMDVYDDDGTALQAQQYHDVLSACIAEPNCTSWTTWGVTDKYDMWQDDRHRMQMGHDFLWGTNYQPTPALTAVRQLLTQ